MLTHTHGQAHMIACLCAWHARVPVCSVHTCMCSHVPRGSQVHKTPSCLRLPVGPSCARQAVAADWASWSRWRIWHLARGGALGRVGAGSGRPPCHQHFRQLLAPASRARRAASVPIQPVFPRQEILRTESSFKVEKILLWKTNSALTRCWVCWH